MQLLKEMNAAAEKASESEAAAMHFAEVEAAFRLRDGYSFRGKSNRNSFRARLSK